MSQKALKHEYRACAIKTINAQHIDDLVRGLVLDHLRRHHLAELRGQAPARDHWIREMIHRIVLATDRLTAEWARDSTRLAPKPATTSFAPVGLAFAWRRELLHTGCSIEIVAQRAGVTEPHVRTLLGLTRLSPMLKSLLSGALGPSATLADLLQAAGHHA